MTTIEKFQVKFFKGTSLISPEGAKLTKAEALEVARVYQALSPADQQGASDWLKSINHGELGQVLSEKIKEFPNELARAKAEGELKQEDHERKEKAYDIKHAHDGWGSTPAYPDFKFDATNSALQTLLSADVMNKALTPGPRP